MLHDGIYKFLHTYENVFNYIIIFFDFDLIFLLLKEKLYISLNLKQFKKYVKSNAYEILFSKIRGEGHSGPFHHIAPYFIVLQFLYHHEAKTFIYHYGQGDKLIVYKANCVQNQG